MKINAIIKMITGLVCIGLLVACQKEAAFTELDDGEAMYFSNAKNSIVDRVVINADPNNESSVLYPGLQVTYVPDYYDGSCYVSKYSIRAVDCICTNDYTVKVRLNNGNWQTATRIDNKNWEFTQAWIFSRTNGVQCRNASHDIEILLENTNELIFQRSYTNEHYCCSNKLDLIVPPGL